MPLGLTSSQLAKMRSQTEELMPDTAVIYSPTNTVDSMGAPSQTYVPVSGGTVVCRVDPLNIRGNQLAIVAGREATSLRYQLTVPYDAPLETDYQIIINSNTYEIIQFDTAHSWNVSKRAIINEVE